MDRLTKLHWAVSKGGLYVFIIDKVETPVHADYCSAVNVLGKSDSSVTSITTELNAAQSCQTLVEPK